MSHTTYVSAVSDCLATSGLQTGLQNKLLTYSFPHPSAPFRGRQPWVREYSHGGSGEAPTFPSAYLLPPPYFPKLHYQLGKSVALQLYHLRIG
jgi:hypothetical protein